MEFLGKIVALKVLVLDDDKFLEEFYSLYSKNKVHDDPSTVRFGNIPQNPPLFYISDQSERIPPRK